MRYLSIGELLTTDEEFVFAATHAETRQPLYNTVSPTESILHPAKALDKAPRARLTETSSQPSAIAAPDRKPKVKKKCAVADCDRRRQNNGLCWTHGGYVTCTVHGCNKRAKSRQRCWSHGGGTGCDVDGCRRIAVSKGACWAHGGGKRCIIDGCSRAATKRMGDRCIEHFMEAHGC